MLCSAVNLESLSAVRLFLQADVEQLVELSFAAAQGYASCKAELQDLSGSSYPQDAAPQQLRCMEQQLVQRLQVNSVSGGFPTVHAAVLQAVVLI
jgi:hypothetical protein